MESDTTRPVSELFVIGNGFDLQCGLGTTYGNFLHDIFESKYKDYCLTKDEDKTVLEEFEKEQEEVLFVYPFYEQNWFSYTPIKFIPGINIWYRIFLYEKMAKTSNWNSVEEMIAEYLLEYDMIDSVSRIILKRKSNGKEFIGGSRIAKRDILSLVAYSIIFKVFRKSVKEIEDTFELVADPENLSYYEKLVDVFESGEEVSYDTVAELVTSVLLHELKELEWDFTCFVKRRLESTDEYLGNVSHLLRKMIDPEADWYDNYENKTVYNLLSFNYTSSWSDRFRPQHSPATYLDVHGRIPKGDVQVSNIIFGIDNEKVDATSLNYRFTKTYRTLQLYSRNFEKVGDERDIYQPTIKKIKFYGHSLAEADYSYFQQMFDYYDLYNNNDLELIFYYSVFDGTSAEQIEQNQILSLSRLIEKYGQTMNNQNHGKNLLTRLIQTNRLKLIRI